MAKISLTDFIDVVSKSGSPKATKVSQIKNRDTYEPATDFYKIFRENVVDIHKTGKDKSELATIASKTSDSKRKEHYGVMAKSYSKWWGKKDLKWFAPTSDIYTSSGIEVSINPELGLNINGDPHLIKLFMKSDALTKLRADLITSIMEETLRSKISNKVVVGVLDVKNAKLFTFSPGAKPLKPLFDAELAYIASLWPNV